MNAQTGPKYIVAVVIPAYNAENTIESVLSQLPRFVNMIFVVDDGSGDDTSKKVMALGDPRVTLIRHEKNQGVGAAVLSGYRAAYENGATIVVKMDADGQMDPNALPQLIRPIVEGKADYTKGNRFLHLRDLKEMPWVRRLGNFGLSLLTKFASGYWNIFDPTNGYTAIHRNLIPVLLRGRVSRRFFFESSVLIELALERAVVKDVPIRSRYPETGSHLSELRSLFSFPPRLFLGFLRRVWVQYIVRDFGAGSLLGVVGFLMVSAGSIFGGYHWHQSALLGRPTPTGTVMIAALLIILGVQALFQALLLDVQSVPKDPVYPELEGEFSQNAEAVALDGEKRV